MPLIRLFLLLLLLPMTLAAAPGWPELPTDGTLVTVARNYCAKYSGRQESIAMPGSPPDGSYTQTTFEPVRLLTFHNPKIADPIASGEAFVLIKRVTEDVHPEGRRQSQSIELLRLVHQDGGFALAHVHGWSEMPDDTELGGFLGGFLNSYYNQSLYDGYSPDDLWLAGFATGGRTITIVAYDGNSDTEHMPFTFHITVVDGGRPAADTEVGIRFVGEVGALADRFASWNESEQKWLDHDGKNFARNEVWPIQLDGRGQAVVRGFLDFGRMRLKNLKLPVSTGIEVSADGAAPQQAMVTLKHPAFIRNVYFWCANDPQWPGAPRWIRLSYLAGAASDQFIEQTEPQEIGGIRLPRNRYGVGDRPSYPTPTEIPKRVLINGAAFQPPDWQRDYFYPVNERDELILDLAVPAKKASGGFTPMQGDGLMVEMLWLDGVTALFAQRRDREDFLVVRLPRSGDALQGTAEQTWIRYFVDEGADWLVTDRLIEAAVVSGATIAGGPAAGAWAAVICEAGFRVKDANALYQAGTTRHKVVLVRSRVAVTHTPEGAMNLYTFEGQPSVLHEGAETTAQAGEAISFTLDSEPSPARATEPPAAAAALAVVELEGGPTGLDPAPPAAAPGQIRVEQEPPMVQDYPVEAEEPDRLSEPLIVREPEMDEELADAQREYDIAYREYTILATTGGEGDVIAALARYKAAYERLQALKLQRGLE